MSHYLAIMANTSRACANAQTLRILYLSNTLSMDVDKHSVQSLGLLPRWIRQPGRLMEFYANGITTKISYINSYKKIVNRISVLQMDR